MSNKDLDQYTYFSFVEPWGYEDSVNFFTDLQKQVEELPDVYFHRELLGYSKELRYVELITLTGNEEMTEEQEDFIEGHGLFPKFKDGTEEAKLFSRERCFNFR